MSQRTIRMNNAPSAFEMQTIRFRVIYVLSRDKGQTIIRSV